MHDHYESLLVISPLVNFSLCRNVYGFYTATLIITNQPLCTPVFIIISHADMQKQFKECSKENSKCMWDIDRLTQRLFFLFDSQLCESGSLDAYAAARNVWCVTQLESPTLTYPAPLTYTQTGSSETTHSSE